MVASKRDSNPASRRPPATTPQGRENQVVAIAYDVAERQLLSGTASSQVITHFLKLGTERERLERVKLEQETLLAQAKIEQLASAKRMEELYLEAMDAFRGYQPSSENDIE
jgi:hypothetical protein